MNINLPGVPAGLRFLLFVAAPPFSKGVLKP